MMKRLFLCTLCGILLAPGLLKAGRLSGAWNQERSITKTFQVSNGANLNITNKFGRVNLHSWDKNQIQAVITITASGGSDENAKNLADQVNIQSSQTGNTVSLTTQYDRNTSSSFWKSFFSGSGGSSKKSIHIDYEVYMPKSLAKLNIQNSYGDVTGSDFPGSVSLILSYGNFHLDKIPGGLDLHVNYCNGTLSGVASGSIEANYTDFKLDQVNNLRIHSNYSDFKIGSGGQMDIQSNYGDFSADHLEGISSQSNYTDYKIEILQKNGKMTTTYGDTHIGTLGNPFSGLVIHSTYGNQFVGIPHNLRVRVNISTTHGNIKNGGVDLQKVVKTDEHGNQTLSGVSAGADGNAPVIEISGNYSDVSLSGR